MELKQGYKLTEVGFTPEDWEVVEFGGICSPIKDKFNPIRSKNRPCIELEDLSQETGRLLSLSDSVKKVSMKTIFKVGDVLFGKLRPYLRKFYFADFDGVCSTEIWALSPKPEIHSKFVFYQVQSKRIIDSANIAIGTKMPRAEWKTVAETRITIPPLLEQIAIANALSDMDALISQTEKLIEKKKAIKQGAMQELLKPKEGWVTKKLGDFNFNISDGNYSSKYPKASEFKEIGIPFIRANNIKRMTVISDDMRFISKQLHEELQKGHLQVDDILITTRGEIGKVALVPDSQVGSNINAQIVRINTNRKINTKYLAYFFMKNETQKVFQNAQTGSALKQLPVNKLKEILITYPREQEQKDIATILYDMDFQIFELESKLNKLKLQKQGMMQALLTGKIRLV